MRKAQEYREHARRCELLLEKVQDPRVRQQLRRERQEWLELAASCEAVLRNKRWAHELPLDQDMTLAALRAFEASRRDAPDDAPEASPPASPPDAPGSEPGSAPGGEAAGGGAR